MPKNLIIVGLVGTLLLPWWAAAQQLPSGVSSAGELAGSISGARSPFVFGEPRRVPLFPIVLDRMVQTYVDGFLANPAGLRNSFERGRPYLSQMVAVLRRWELPDDLVYLAFAESGFCADGAGPWQLNKSTARQYGLHINSYVDERRDPIQSTRAAAEYLASLHEQTSDWRLTLVGWNTGDSAVDSFLRLRHTGYENLISHLPQRTSALLNRFMAAALIGRFALSYGLKPVEFSAPPPYRTIKVAGGCPLSRVASRENTTVEQLRSLNPALRTNRVPPYASSYDIRVPARTAAIAADDAKPL